MRNIFNVEKMVRLIVMVILSFFMIYAVVSGKLQNYVNPRMNAVVILTAVILIFIVIFTIPDLKRKKHTVFVKDYLILLLPLILACVVPYNTFDVDRDVNLDSSFASSSVKTSSDSTKSEDKKNEKKQDTKKAVDPMIKNGQTWDVSNDEFAHAYLRISGDMEFYEGQKIKMKGQFFKAKDFSDDEFVLARMAMVCCAADLQPCGFLCKYKDTGKYQSEQWLSVTGTIHVEEYKGEKMPVIHVEVINDAQAPKDKYIYFNR